MKKLITVIAIALISIMTIDAQINLPRVNSSTGEIKTASSTQGIEVDFSKIKSFKEIQRLNIPTAQISSKQLLARSKKKWKVSPWKMTDGNLVISYVFGVYESKKFYMQSSSIIPSRIPGLPGTMITTFPIRLNFMAKAGIEYKLKLKHEGPYKSNTNILVSINNMMFSVTMNRQREFIMVFTEEESKKVKIKFSGFVSSRREPLSDPLIVSEIQIDELIPN